MISVIFSVYGSGLEVAEYIEVCSISTSVTTHTSLTHLRYQVGFTHTHTHTFTHTEIYICIYSTGGNGI